MSALTTCKTCSKEVAKSAHSCPHCGARLKRGFLFKLVVGVAGLFVLAVFLASFSRPKTASDATQPAQTAAATEQISDVSPRGELAEMFNLMSQHTDVQRENKLKELKGKTVRWTLIVFEVKRKGDGYLVQTLEDGTAPTFVSISPRDDNERRYIESLKTGDSISIKAKIDGVFMRHLMLRSGTLDNQTSPTSTTPPTIVASATTASPPVANESVRTDSTNNSSVTIAGKYLGHNDGEQELEVALVSSDKVLISVSVTAPGCFGSVGPIEATLISNVARYDDKAGCALIVEFGKERVMVIDACQVQHGTNCTFEGSYLLAKQGG